MSAADGGNQSAMDAQVGLLWSFVLQTPADHDSELGLGQEILTHIQ